MKRLHPTLRLRLLLLPLALLAACASPREPKPSPQPAGFNAVLVTARDVRPGYGPLGVGDRFPLEGRIVAYVSLTWADVNLEWGQQPMEWRWYLGDRLVKRSEGVFKSSKPPHYIWSATQPVALGVGKGHVEFVIGDQVIAKRHFEIFDTATSLPPPLSKGTPL